MGRSDDQWGRRRPARRRPKPYNDDYKDDYDDYTDEEDLTWEKRGNRNPVRSDSRTRRPSSGNEGDGRSAGSSRNRAGNEARTAGNARNYTGSADRSASRGNQDRRRPAESSRYEGRREAPERSSRDRYEEEERRRNAERRRAEERRRDEARSRDEARRRNTRPYPDDRYYDDRRYDDRRYDDRRYRPRRRKHRGLKVVLVIVLILAAVIAAAAIYLTSLWGRTDSADFSDADISVNSDLPASVAEHAKNYRQILIFGVDSRDNTTLQAGTLADSNILCTINRKTGEVKLTSIYRDTYVRTEDGDGMKLTEVYNKLGAKGSISTINRNFDLNVKDYITVNWKAVAQTINELGGLDLELSEKECEGINKYIHEVEKSTGLDSKDVEEKAGTQHLDGIQAVTYCRLRKGLGDDYKRTERQRIVIEATLAKAKSAGIPKALGICNDVFPSISSNMSMTDIAALAAGLGRLQVADSEGFPYEKRTEDGGHYYLYPDTLASNVTELHQKVYGDSDYAPSGTVRSISEKIEARD